MKKLLIATSIIASSLTATLSSVSAETITQTNNTLVGSSSLAASLARCNGYMGDMGHMELARRFNNEFVGVYSRTVEKFGEEESYSELMNQGAVIHALTEKERILWCHRTAKTMGWIK